MNKCAEHAHLRIIRHAGGLMQALAVTNGSEQLVTKCLVFNVKLCYFSIEHKLSQYIDFEI